MAENDIIVPKENAQGTFDEVVLTPAQIGAQASGDYATLVNGLVPSNQLPSFVDDVLEFANLAAFPATGESGKIYVAIDTRKTYRYSGSTYVEISPSEVTSVNGQTGAVTVSVPSASTATPASLGTAAAGTSENYARADHVHSLPTANELGALDASADLSDLDNPEQARINLGLGTAATADSTNFAAATHAASHASAGSDPLAPSAINAQSIYSVSSVTGAGTLAASRAIEYLTSNYGSSPYTITLPLTAAGSLNGDTFVFRSVNAIGADVTIQYIETGTPVSLATISAVGQQLRFRFNGGANEWSLISVDSHPANRITSGTLTHERGGLEADVSAYSGLLKISGGATSAVTVTTAGEALLDDVDAAAQRTTLGLGTAATAATGDFAAASHSHGNLTSAGAIGSTAGLPVITTTSGALTTLTLGAANTVLKVNSGGTAVEFGAAGGVTSGSVDNAILRADGAGGSTSQSSDLVIDDATTTTQNNVAIRNNHSLTDSALVLTPKGTGAFIVGAKPDGTAAGGNARGANAIDAQYSTRSAATQIASGARSVIIGGIRNTASGTDSFVAGGVDNIAGQAGAFVCGNQNSASGVNSFASGSSNTVTGASSAIVCGRNSVADRPETLVHGTGRFSGSGDAQTIRTSLRNKTTTSTPIELFMGFSADTRFTIPSGKTMSALINIIAATSGGEFANRYIRAVTIANRGGTTALRGAVKEIETEEQIGGADVTISANDTNDAIRIEFSGVAPVAGCTTSGSGTAAVINKVAHGYSNNDDIVFTSLTGGAGLTANTVTYWVINVTADTFQVSATRGGTSVNISTNYSDMTAARLFRVVAGIDAVEVGHGT